MRARASNVMIGTLTLALIAGSLGAFLGYQKLAVAKQKTAFRVIFGLYSVLSLKRPDIHALSFVAFTFGAGAACLIPLFIWELFARPLMQIDTANLLTLAYVALFPSTIAYLCFNRGVQLIGANRAAPFFHVVPVFGTVMSIIFLGEHPQAFHFLGFALVLTGVFVASRKPATS